MTFVPHGDFCGKISLFQDCFLVSPFPLANSNHNVPQSNEKAMLLRLCLVHEKYFPENKYFLKMLFSGKENIFRCLVAFQNIF